MTGIEATGKRSVTEVRRSRPYHALVGVGLVSYGLLHLIIAWIALQLVFGKRAEASPEGALSQLGRQPLGDVLLWIMAVGLFTLTIWQAVEATIGRDQPGRDGRTRRRLTSAGRAVVYLALGVLAVGVATRTASGSGHGEETISAKLMSVPFGQVLVALIGAVVIGVGIAQVVKGVKQNFTEDLDRGAPPSVRRLGSHLAQCYSPSWLPGLHALVSTASSGPKWRATDLRTGGVALGGALINHESVISSSSSP
jgi:hypothetical protein